jgi:hypothetical protein
MAAARPEPFALLYCAAVTLALGRSAQTLRELRDHIAEVPPQSLAHHFFETLLRPDFDDPEYRNDFALWAHRQLRDRVLAERLAVIDPLQFAALDDLRQHLLEVIEDRLAETSSVLQVTPGLEFNFLRSQLVVLDTGLRAATPEALAELVPGLTQGNLYVHFVEARRTPPGLDDFSRWIEAWGAPYDNLCRQLRAIDFHQWSLSDMRARLVECFAPFTSGREVPT